MQVGVVAGHGRNYAHRGVMVKLPGEGEAEAVETKGEDERTNWRRNCCKHVCTAIVMSADSVKGRYNTNRLRTKQGVSVEPRRPLMGSAR